jgi:exodeoxyribonuclease VII small subunit
MADATPAANDDSALEQMRFEQAVEELEAIIERIERGEVGLEESLAQWKRGQALIRRCRAILDVAEQQVQQLTAADMEGNARESR